MGYILRRRANMKKACTPRAAVARDPRNFYTLIQLSVSYTNLRRYAQESALDRA